MDRIAFMNPLMRHLYREYFVHKSVFNMYDDKHIAIKYFYHSHDGWYVQVYDFNGDLFGSCIEGR